MKETKSKKFRECPAEKFQKMISGKYKLRILWSLQDGPKRYSELKRGLLSGQSGSPEIAPRVLTRELKVLRELGLIFRKDFRTLPPKVAYRLTDSGTNFIPVIAAMHGWATRYL